jgi:3-phosphoshikimate 1-carboxyvinyltransferase
MNLKISTFATHIDASLNITGSKSETNRVLLQALFSNITLENTSNSDDSEVMSKALANSQLIHNSQLIDIHHAGTAMRFLTAYFAVSEGVK